MIDLSGASSRLSVKEGLPNGSSEISGIEKSSVSRRVDAEVSASPKMDKVRPAVKVLTSPVKKALSEIGIEDENAK